MESERDYILRQQSELDRKLVRQLHKIKRLGWAGKDTIDLLWINELIQFGGPSDTNKYNHYRLTEKGEEILQKNNSYVKTSLYKKV